MNLREAICKATRQAQEHDLSTVHAVHNGLAPATCLNVLRNKSISCHLGSVRAGAIGVDQLLALLDNQEGWEVSADIPY